MEIHRLSIHSPIIFFGILKYYNEANKDSMKQNIRILILGVVAHVSVKYYKPTETRQRATTDNRL